MYFMAEKVVNYLIKNNIITPDLNEIYIYGFEVLMGKIVNYGTLFLLSYFNNNIIETMVFMITFFSLRGRTGGYHSESSIRCYLGTLIMYFLVSKVISPFCVRNIGVSLLIMGISVILIFLFAPVNHPNLELEQQEKQLCKIISRIMVVVIMAIVVVSIWLEIIPVYISYVVAGIGMDAGLLILAKIIRQEVQDNEQSKKESSKSYCECSKKSC